MRVLKMLASGRHEREKERTRQRKTGIQLFVPTVPDPASVSGRGNLRSQVRA